MDMLSIWHTKLKIENISEFPHKASANLYTLQYLCICNVHFNDCTVKYELNNRLLLNYILFSCVFNKEYEKQVKFSGFHYGAMSQKNLFVAPSY